MSEFKPGPELDALVAEKVMGYQRYRKIPCEHCDFHPSTDIRAAWEVVEKMAKQTYRPWPDDDIEWPLSIEIWMCADWCWKAVFWRDQSDNIRPAAWACDSAPHAICLAALAAVEDK